MTELQSRARSNSSRWFATLLLLEWSSFWSVLRHSSWVCKQWKQFPSNTRREVGRRVRRYNLTYQRTKEWKCLSALSRCSGYWTCLYPVKWMALDQLNVHGLGGCCCGWMGKCAFTIFKTLVCICGCRGRENWGRSWNNAFFDYYAEKHYITKTKM